MINDGMTAEAAADCRGGAGETERKAQFNEKNLTKILAKFQFEKE